MVDYVYQSKDTVGVDERKYGDIIRERMEQRGVTLRMLERDLRHTYEQFRKIVKMNLPVASRQLNDRLSRHLGLDPEKMWSILEREKMQRRAGRLKTSYEPPPARRFREIWPQLTPADVEKLWTIASAMAMANEEAGLVRPRRQRVP